MKHLKFLIVIFCVLLSACDTAPKAKVDAAVVLSDKPTIDSRLLEKCPTTLATLSLESEIKLQDPLVAFRDSKNTYDECRGKHNGLRTWVCDFLKLNPCPE